MPPPRITVGELPLKVTPDDTDVLLIEDGSGYHKATVESVKGAASAEIADHIADPTGAHAASAVSATDSGNGVDGTTVQAQLGQLATAAAAATTAVADHLGDAADAHDASAVSFVPTGTVAATDVQAAIAEVSADVTALDTRVDDLESSGTVQSVVAGSGIAVDNTDPLNPVITALGGGEGGSGLLVVDAGGDASTARPDVSADVTVLWINTPTEPVNLGPVDLWEDNSVGGGGGGGIVPFDAEGNASAARPDVSSTVIVLWTNTPSEPVNLGPFDMWEDIS